MSMHSRLHSVLLLLFLQIVAFGPQQLWAVTSTNHLAIHRMVSFPQVIVDSGSYDLSFYVVNEDPIYPWVGGIAVAMSVNGDEGDPLISEVMPASAIAPGDSLLVQIPQYTFDALRFQGGGITHDIIVWPMKPSLPQSDSTSIVVSFEHTSALSCDHLSVGLFDGFPTTIVGGEIEDFSLVIKNEDPLHHLFHPVQLLMSIDGDEPTQLLLPTPLEEALAPGDSLKVPIRNYLFNPSRFQGGGITHDIIVWPMASFVQQSDSMIVTVRFEPSTSNGMANGSGLTQPIFIGVDGIIRWKEAINQPLAAEIKLFSLHGINLWQHQTQLQPGLPVIALPISNLNSGLYLYELKVGKTVYQGKWWYRVGANTH